MFFWNGKAYKLGRLHTEVDTTDYMKPWKFRDDDGKFEFVMTPIYDKVTNGKVPLKPLLKSIQMISRKQRNKRE